jgi:RecJ-like exonuclease
MQFQGTGYIACGACSGEGLTSQTAPAPAASSSSAQAAAQAPGSKPPLIAQAQTGPVMVAGERCGSCSGTGKVMCIACLCTGKKVAREHDVRLDPFF